MLSFMLSGNISMDNHQWRLSQAYTYALYISKHISITLISYHLIFLLHVNFFYYMFYVFGISFICTFSVFLFLYFTYSYTYHVFIFHASHMSFQGSYCILCTITYTSRTFVCSYSIIYFVLSYTFCTCHVLT